MTKFLIDENIPPPVVSFLRSKGFDVKTLELLMLQIGHCMRAFVRKSILLDFIL
jgi:hypothetical protein